MSARPRKASDEEVFAAVYRVMNRLAPAQVTLTAIAAEAGVTPSALVQRWGSKRQLLIDVTRRAADGTAEYLERIRSEHDSPLDALHAYAACFAAMAESPETLAHHLAYLQLDLTDPEFRRSARAQARVADRAIRELIGEAVALGELEPGTDVEGVARAVIAVMGGSLLAWAIRHDGTAERAMRADLNAVLAPYRPRSGGKRARPRRRVGRGTAKNR